MPRCEATAYREPDGQYSWVYFKDNQFQEIGGANLTLANVVNAMRDKIATEANVGQAKVVTLAAEIPG